MLPKALARTFMTNGDSVLDFRSDTVTKPTESMRRAMAEAIVVDQAYEEDLAVRELEYRAAILLGKEDAVLVPTGTMANTIAVKLLTKHGQEVICDSRSHVFEMELAMMAWFSGCQAKLIEAHRGLLHWKDLDGVFLGAAKVGRDSRPWQGAIVLENTHNFAGGTVYPLNQIREICDYAHRSGVGIHMDGARLFNAAAYLNCDVAEITSPVDTVAFCLSKGLGAPAGSILAGPGDKIAKAREYRNLLGGRMKGLGILAVAGLVAIDHPSQALNTDHENAQYLARELASMSGIELDLTSVQTNIVIFGLGGIRLTVAEFKRRLGERGLLASMISGEKIRLVTHRDVTRDDCRRTTGIISGLLTEYFLEST